MENQISKRFGSAIMGCLAALCASGCAGSDRALILFDVKVAADVPDFKTLAFSNPGDPSVSARIVDGPSHRPEFNFGYYVSHPNGTVTVVASATRADGCVVGEGRAMISGVTSGKQLQGGVLLVAKLEGIKCSSGDGGQDRGDVPTDLAADSFADVDGGQLANGERCATDGECAIGHCVDGVCCESACAGQCTSCNEPDGGAGKCLIVMGTPRGTRMPCGGSAPCNARCDGTDGVACKYPGSSVQCVAGSCSNGSINTATTCDGTGACTASTTSKCSSNQCADSTKCSGGCSASAPCEKGKYCDATGVCLPAKNPGDPCQNNDECSSLFCVDSVCCSSACKGQCESCHEPNKIGTCIIVSGAPRGTRPGCLGSQASCAGQCDGTTATVCSYPGASRVCTAASCSSSSTLVSASVCNGGGACSASTTSMCGSGMYCSGGACVAQLGNGSACSSTALCQSGNCTVGVCCASGQTGCHGLCKSLATDSANCGACDKACPGSSCSNGILTSATSCNGAGACTVPTTSPCPNQCADSTRCSGGCSAANPCASGKFCDASGVCQPTKANGLSCQSGTECTTGACVDGVCCSSACDGQCQACNEPNSSGTCITVSGTPRGSRPACAGAQTVCGGQCGGAGAPATACVYPNGTTCFPAMCNGNFAVTSASLCNGNGACAAGSTTSCANGTYCSSGSCIPQLGNGSACQTTAQCQSANCSAGLCCASDQNNCSGVCRSLATDSSNCGTCGRQCSGSQCLTGTFTSATACNGAGSCTSPTISSCPSGFCANDTKCSYCPASGSASGVPASDFCGEYGTVCGFGGTGHYADQSDCLTRYGAAPGSFKNCYATSVCQARISGGNNCANAASSSPCN